MAGLSPVTVVVSGLLAARTAHTPVGISVVRNDSPDLGPIPSMIERSKHYAAAVQRKNSQIELLNGRINAVNSESEKLPIAWRSGETPIPVLRESFVRSTA